MMLKTILTEGGRKWTVAVGALVAVTALCAFARLSGGEFVTALGIIFGVFSAGNVMEHRA